MASIGPQQLINKIEVSQKWHKSEIRTTKFREIKKDKKTEINLSNNLHSHKCSWSWWKRMYFSIKLNFRHFIHGKTSKICLHFVKFLLKLTATKKPSRNTFIVLRSNLVFLMFGFFPLNLHWNPKMMQGNTEIKWKNERKDFLIQMFSNIEWITPISRKSPQKTCKKTQFDVFY